MRQSKYILASISFMLHRIFTYNGVCRGSASLCEVFNCARPVIVCQVLFPTRPRVDAVRDSTDGEHRPRFSRGILSRAFFSAASIEEMDILCKDRRYFKASLLDQWHTSHTSIGQWPSR